MSPAYRSEVEFMSKFYMELSIYIYIELSSKIIFWQAHQ